MAELVRHTPINGKMAVRVRPSSGCRLATGADDVGDAGSSPVGGINENHFPGIRQKAGKERNMTYKLHQNNDGDTYEQVGMTGNGDTQKPIKVEPRVSLGDWLIVLAMLIALAAMILDTF